MTASAAGLLKGALDAALAAADPGPATAARLPPPRAGRVIVVGAGKAAAAMARAADAGYHDVADVTGLVITAYGMAAQAGRVEVVEAAHPVPDPAGVAATARMLELVRAATPDDLVVCLLSGGGSALACAPVGLTLWEKAGVTRELLASGADIRAVNVVRKHLSGVKGGWLAAASAAPVVTLAVSDVVGDDPGTIASGPTVPDPSTFQDAMRVLERYAPAASAAKRALEAGGRGERPETPKPGAARLANSRYEVVASGAAAVAAAAEHLRAAGVEVLARDAAVVGDSTAVALRQAGEVRGAMACLAAAGPVAFVYGGETTVDRVGSQLVFGAGGEPDVSAAVRPPRGGPNGEWALAFTAALAGAPERWLLAVDTDGIDGDSTGAGALLGPREARRLGLVQVADYLRRHDSHTLLERVGGLLVTGPTRTNVNALRIVLFPPRA